MPSIAWIEIPPVPSARTSRPTSTGLSTTPIRLDAEAEHTAAAMSPRAAATSATDDWIVDVTSHCSPILTGFTGALDDLDGRITVQAREPMVDEGDWRGLAWRNTH